MGSSKLSGPQESSFLQFSINILEWLTLEIDPMKRKAKSSLPTSPFYTRDKWKEVGCAKSFTSWETIDLSPHSSLPLDKPLRLLLTSLSWLVKRGQHYYFLGLLWKIIQRKKENSSFFLSFSNIFYWLCYYNCPNFPSLLPSAQYPHSLQQSPP